MSVPNGGGNLMRYRDLGLMLMLAQSAQNANHEDALLDELADLWAGMSAEERLQSEVVNRELREFFRGFLAGGHSVIFNQSGDSVRSGAQQSSRETILNEGWRFRKMQIQWVEQGNKECSSLGASAASQSLRRSSVRRASTLFANA